MSITCPKKYLEFSFTLFITLFWQKINHWILFENWATLSYIYHIYIVAEITQLFKIYFGFYYWFFINRHDRNINLISILSWVIIRYMVMTSFNKWRSDLFIRLQTHYRVLKKSFFLFTKLHLIWEPYENVIGRPVYSFSILCLQNI